jgi:hypothetical protein
VTDRPDTARLVEQVRSGHLATNWAEERELALKLADEVERLTGVLQQIADPSYIGAYDNTEIVMIHRKWARNALAKEKP